MLLSFDSGLAVDTRLAVNSFTGTFDDLASFVTMSQCSTAPQVETLYLCHPARMAFGKKTSLQKGVFFSVNELVLDAGEAILRNKQNDSFNKLMSSYEYAELLASSRIDYFRENWMVGLRPYKVTGQFSRRNPSLPLASVSLRTDTVPMAGVAYAHDIDTIKIGIGAFGRYVIREELIAEGSVSDIAGYGIDEVIQKQDVQAALVDVGLLASVNSLFNVSLQLKNAGGLVKGKDLASETLFVANDFQTRVEYAVGLTPTLFYGKTHLGFGFSNFFQQDDTVADLWFGTLSYYVGPLSIMSGFRNQFLRTGLGLSYNPFRFALAQEWINKIQVHGKTQPRFTFEVAVEL